MSYGQHKRAASGPTSHQCTEAAAATATATTAVATRLSISVQENRSLSTAIISSGNSLHCGFLKTLFSHLLFFLNFSVVAHSSYKAAILNPFVSCNS